MKGIQTIRLRNFRRYEDETVELRDGLNFLEGENNAGKTSVLYAIEYALFGRVGSLVASALMRPKTRTVGVELCFVGRDGRHYRLQRIHVKPPKSRKTVHGHFTLKVREPDEEAEQYVVSSDFDDLETDLAAALQSALGFTRRAWELAVHHRQGRISEILDGSSQLDMVLGVTSSVFVEEELRAMALEREKAAKELPALEAKLVQLDAEKTERVARAEALRADLVAANERVAAVESRRAGLESRQTGLDAIAAQVEALSDAESEVSEAEAEATRTRAVRDGLGEQAALEAALAAVDAELPALEATRSAGREAVRALNDEAKSLAASRGDVEGRLSRRQSLESGAVCDHCGQAVDAAHLAAEIPALEAELAEMVAKTDSVDSRIAAAEAEVEAAEEAWSAAKVKRAEAESAVERHAEARAAVESAESVLKDAATTRDAARAEAEGAVDGVSADGLAAHLQEQRDGLVADTARVDADAEHAEELVERIEAELGDVDEAIARCDRESAEARVAADKLRADAEVAKKLRVLGKGFKEVQKDLREGASERMGERAFQIHEHLSGDDRELEALDIDPKKYAVLVTPNDVGAKVPAALYQGGGHRLLLGLAVKLALAEQIGPFPFVLLDEPTYGLDGPRKLALLERISELEVADQLVLITHADLGDASGHRQRVVRDGKLSRIHAGAPEASP